MTDVQADINDMSYSQLALMLRNFAEDERLDKFKLVRIIQAMADGVLVFDQKGKILLYNPALQANLGLQANLLVETSLSELFQELIPELAESALNIFETGQPFSQEISIHLNYQKRVFLLNIIPIEENGVIADGVVVFHDISKVKQTEKMRRDFVANVSHELRTPLSAISGYAETLLDGALEDAAVAKDFVQIIFNHSQRLSLLVRDLLDLSKLESEECPFELQPVSLVPIIEKVIQLSETQLTNKQIQLSFNPKQYQPTVLAHEYNIEQVLVNLLDNAIKYSPSEGKIDIAVLESKAGFIQVDVKDSGMGIESKHIPRLFERFYRVDKARSRDLGGTGLGLAIVKHIIQYHGGDVWVNSTPGVGSTFSFTLKLAS